MAVSSQAVDFDDFHFIPEDFDRLKRQHGKRALIRLATLCPCWPGTTGSRDPACQLCFPFGRIYNDEIEAWVLGPGQPTKQLLAEGAVDIDDVLFTLPSTLIAGDHTRLVLPDAHERVSDLLTKGTEDIIRFSHVVAVEQAFRVVRNPPTGDPYENELVPLELGTDLTIEDRRVVWPGGSSVPDGTRYAVSLVVQSEYVFWGAPKVRVENGQQLPGRYRAKRMDFLLHPKGEAELSF